VDTEQSRTPSHSQLLSVLSDTYPALHLFGRAIESEANRLIDDLHLGSGWTASAHACVYA
jgi:hypothetical protein